MKKPIISILLLFFTFFSSNAQTNLAPLGAEWWYGSNDGFGSSGIHFVLNARASHDTLINGFNCQVIQQKGIVKTSSSISWPPTYSTPDTVLYDPLFIYNTIDTVFIFNPFFDKFTPLYIYNVTEGQTLCLPVLPDLKGHNAASTALIDSTFCFVVDSVRNVVYNTTTLKTIYTHALYDTANFPINPINQPRAIANWSHADYKNVGVYTQGFGGFHGGILPVVLYDRGRFDGTDMTANVGLRCYSDSNFVLQYTNSCDYLPETTSVFDKKNSDFGISIYPNPNSGLLNFQTKKPLLKDIDIRVMDISGRLVRKGKLKNGVSNMVMNLAALNNGMYYIELTEGENYYHQKITINH